MTNYFSNGTATTQGVEAESTILVGGGLAIYMNGTAGSAKYASTGQWVQNAPKDTETLGLTFNRGSWNVGFFSKRVGQMYNDNGAVHQAFTIDPFTVANFTTKSLMPLIRFFPVQLIQGAEGRALATPYQRR